MAGAAYIYLEATIGALREPQSAREIVLEIDIVKYLTIFKILLTITNKNNEI